MLGSSLMSSIINLVSTMIQHEMKVLYRGYINSLVNIMLQYYYAINPSSGTSDLSPAHHPSFSSTEVLV